ncbi:MAG: mandelate racemase [Chloroflexi bacterium]|nr:mandelate racemase [Chloroflexota bacterium]
MAEPRIDRIESAPLSGRRPRAAGNNARLNMHGIEVELRVMRLTTSDGASGFGLCFASAEEAERLLGVPVSNLRPDDGSVAADWRAFEFPVWDLAGALRGKPVYALAASDDATLAQPLRVPCYDTSLYMNDLRLAEDDAGAALIAGHARDGYDKGHRAFKIKVGRGARHMPLEAGVKRDIAVIKAVRAAVGPESQIMIDANNGYILNIAKRILAETADCKVFWLEEAFHEDPELYAELRRWLDAEGIATLIADGEGWAAEPLMDWARAGFVEVVQYDIFSHGFSNWLDTGAQLDAWGVRTAPHHYGRHLGNYVTGHLAPAIRGFTFVEWDEATTPGIDASAYRVEDGQVLIPDAPGYGLKLDEAVFRQAVADGGFELFA